MAASTSDILTVLKNIPTALNGLGATATSIYNTQSKQQIAFGPIGTAITTLYTASVSSASHIDCINFCNTTASAIDVSMFIVPSGGAYSTNNAIFYNFTMPAKTTVLWQGSIVMPASSVLQGIAAATGVTVNVTGGNTL